MTKGVYVRSEKHKEAIRKMANDPEWRRNITEANRKKANDPEWRQKQRDGALKRSQDPEWRRKQKEGVQKNAQDPAWRLKQSIAAKKRWNKNIDDDEVVTPIPECWLDLNVVDPNMRHIIKFMNMHFGSDMHTISCCGGHVNATEHQNPQGTFYVAYSAIPKAALDFTKMVYEHIYELQGEECGKVFLRTKIEMIYDEDVGKVEYNFSGNPDDFEWMKGEV